MRYYLISIAPSRRTNSRGFTLVELLVVISIIGILVALLMPAINNAREAGRMTQCNNNCHQLALACIAHESKYGFFPTGGWGFMWVGDPDRGFTNRQPGGWQYNILPFLDLSDLHDLGTGSGGQWGSGPTTWPNNALANMIKRAQTPVAVFNCPSRRRLTKLPYPGNLPPWNVPTMTAGVAARSDYAANAGGDEAIGSNNQTGQNEISELYSFVETYSQADTTKSDSDWNTKPGGTNPAGVSPAPHVGPIFLHSQCTSAEIRDGTTYTYLLGERFVTTDFYYGGSGCDDDQSWDIGFDYDTNRWSYFPPQRDTPLKPNQTNQDCMQMFGSAHPAGFHMAFCDGSVRKMNYNIDPALHRQLGNRDDGQPTQLQKVDAASQ